MLSINTNLASLIAQNSMSKATDRLNLAIERMTTGAKLNHAKDNAANYSISQKMSMQISSFDVAADNVAMGIDLVTTASDIISTMQDHANRLQALCTQARNGTYGQQSIDAINTEASAIMAEISRLYSTAEYNGVNLFVGKINATFENSFVADPITYTDTGVAAMTPLTEVVTTVSAGQKYSISNEDELVNLAELVNSGVDTTNVEFVLGADIDLSSVSNWIPIGDYSTNSSYEFKGVFDGNGHVIKNLVINSINDNQGLFGRIASGSEIKNVGISGCKVKGNGSVGALVGYNKGSIINSYAIGYVIGTHYTGGLVGYSSSAISKCYTAVDVSGTSSVGGLVGETYASISDSYTTGEISGSGNYVGGIAGYVSSSSVSNCNATGDVSGNNFVGGLFGRIYKTSGTLNITNSVSYGSVSGNDKVGSFIGGIINTSNNTSFATINITNCSAISQDVDMISGCYTSATGNPAATYDMTTMLAGISAVVFMNISTTLQVGINSDNSNQISFDTNFDFNLGALNDMATDSALDSITEFQNLLNEKSTELGAVENRLQSAFESIEVNLENLTASLSTIRDADIADVSSDYIRQQILQQAASTLLATANQSPSIALQLI